MSVLFLHNMLNIHSLYASCEQSTVKSMYGDTNGTFSQAWTGLAKLWSVGGKKIHLVSFSATYAVCIIKMNQSTIILLENDSIYKPIIPWQFQPLSFFFFFLTVFWPFCWNSLNELKSEYPNLFPSIIPFSLHLNCSGWMATARKRGISRAPWTLPNVPLQFKIN